MSTPLKIVRGLLLHGVVVATHNIAQAVASACVEVMGAVQFETQRHLAQRDRERATILRDEASAHAKEEQARVLVTKGMN